MRLTRTNTLGIRVDSVTTDDIPGLLKTAPAPERAVLFSFVNPGCVAAADRDTGYRQSLDAFDAVLPDGIGMCWAIRVLHRLPAARVSFDTTSLAPLVFRHAAQQGLTIALVGGKPGVAEQAAQRLRQAFAGLVIAGTFDGYGNHASKIGELKALSPAVTICGMGTGRQERFLLELANCGWCGLGFTCGGYLDQLAGGLHYYPRWVDATNLRWAYRVAREPRRLGRRYGVDYAVFARRLARALMAPRAGADCRPAHEA